MAVITDNFTDTNGTLLESHISPGGETWVSALVDPPPHDVLTIQSNAATKIVGGSGLIKGVYQWVTAGSPADFSLYATFTFTNVVGTAPFLQIRGGGVGLNIERLTGADDGKWSVYETPGLAGPGALSGYDDGLPHIAKLEMIGNSFTFYLDGVSVFTDTRSPRFGGDPLILSIGRDGGSGLVPTVDSISLDYTQWIAETDFVIPNEAMLGFLLKLAGKNLIPLDVMMFLAYHRNYIAIPPVASMRDAQTIWLVPHGTNPGGVLPGGTPPPLDGQLWPRGQKSG